MKEITVLNLMEQYFEKEVRVETVNGNHFEGVVTGTANDFETNSGNDEVEITPKDGDDCEYVIEIPMIKSIEVVKGNNL